MTAPPFAYFGGKTTLGPAIAALLPPHEHYVEPFGDATGNRGRRTEVLWSNRPIGETHLFSEVAG